MTGRQEHHEKIEKKIKENLQNQPQIIKDFYYSMVDKTANTKRMYISSVLDYFDYLKKNEFDYTNGKNFSKIKPSGISSYLEYLKYKIVNGEKVETTDSSRIAKYYAIRYFYDFLLNEEYIDSNPCNRVKPPRCTVEREVISMTPSEINLMKYNIVNGLGTKKGKTRHQKWVNRDLCILTLGCTTGLRVSSISEINMSDIDFENYSIIVREKGNKERVVYLGQNTMNLLNVWIYERRFLKGENDTDALFISRLGNRLTDKAIRDMIKKYSLGVNKRITPHKMRSSCATNLYEATGDIYLVQDVLGHKNISNTMRYAKVSERKRKEAVDLLDRL